MPILTVEIPDELYDQALETLIELRRQASPTPQAHPSHEEQSGVWQVESADPADESDDFARLVELYDNLTSLGRRAIDHLANRPRGVSAEDLAVHLGLDTPTAVPGVIGGAAKIARRLDRETIVTLDRTTDSYRLEAALTDAVRQARLWSVGPQYDHVFTSPDGNEHEQRRNTPARYWLQVHDDEDNSANGFHDTREALLEADPEAFDSQYASVIEFAPDHAQRQLVPLTEIDPDAAPPIGYVDRLVMDK